MLLIICIFVFILIGCDTNSYTVEKTDDGGTIVYSSDYGTTYSYDELPINIEYNGNDIKCLYTEIYQEKAEHGYDIYVVASIDLSELSEDDIYWIGKDEELRISVLLTNKENDVEGVSMNELCMLENNNVRRIVFYLNDTYRYTFANSCLSTFTDIKKGKQTDTFIYKTIVSDNIKSTSEIGKDLLEEISAAFQRQIENLQNLY